MREIRFRAWDKDYGIILDNIQAKPGFLFRDFLNNERFVVEQFTGLKDMNGKEVYEGDIVKFDNSDIGGKKYTGEIIWCDDPTVGCLGWGLWIKNSGYLHTDFLGSIEVIGDIHKNPELLKD